MAPYEFEADKYISLHTRFYLGGALFDKVPLLQIIEWRERFSFHTYWGNISNENIDYNQNSNFNIIGKVSFMEASIGIGNIFHVISIEYYRRLNYLNNPYAKKQGIYIGLTLSFKEKQFKIIFSLFYLLFMFILKLMKMQYQIYVE